MLPGRYGASAGEDPFAKVKQLITNMIAKLEKEAGADANQKAYCDEEMANPHAHTFNRNDSAQSLNLPSA